MLVELELRQQRTRGLEILPAHEFDGAVAPGAIGEGEVVGRSQRRLEQPYELVLRNETSGFESACRWASLITACVGQSQWAFSPG